jgi:Protein of unknown function (DUF3572)
MHDLAAETLALEALGYLAADQAGLVRFLAASGLERDDLRARAASPELLAGVLDFVLSDDALLADFCDARRLSAKDVHRARRALPGAAFEG